MNTRSQSNRGSALIIVLWVAFGLVALALYFGESMMFEYRAADNRASAIQAEQAVAGAARYVTNILWKQLEPGLIPDTNYYRAQEMQIGDARAWLIGRDQRLNFGMSMGWGLVDEGSKLNLNVVTTNMLAMLPRMTPELMAAIIDWRDDNEEISQGGAESETYSRRAPSYQAKNTNYESVAELRLVAGMDLDFLFGEDANLNGFMDRNENDSEATMPFDNRDGRLDAGLMEFFTVYTRPPTVGTNVSDTAGLQALMSSKLGREVNVTAPANGFTSLLQFFFASGLTVDEMALIEGYLVCTNATNALININTASPEALACVPGIGLTNYQAIVAYRQSNPPKQTVAWLKDALGWTQQDNAAQIAEVGPWVCGRSYQMSADIAAVGPNGRGYKRVKYVFDTADGDVRTRVRQDLTYLGWALGPQVRQALMASNTRR